MAYITESAYEGGGGSKSLEEDANVGAVVVVVAVAETDLLNGELNLSLSAAL